MKLVRWPGATTWLALAFLIVNAIFLIGYLFYGYQALFHSDSAVKVLIAREIIESGNWFPRDWNYVNGDLFVLFGHAVVVPLLTFMPANYAVHAISGLVFSVLILAGIWFVSSLAPIGSARRLLVVAVFAAGISGSMAENLYGQVSYGTIVYFSCFILFFSWRCLSSEGAKRVAWGAALFVLVLLAFWANPQRGLVSYGLPLLAATSYLLARPERPGAQGRGKATLFLLGAVSFGALLGGYLHAQTIAEVNNVRGADETRWLPYDLMVRNAGLLLQQHLAIFGGLPPAKGMVLSKEGVYAAARFVAAISLLVLAPRAILNTLQRKDPAMVFLCVFSVAALLLALLVQVATTVPQMSDPIQSARYLVPAGVLMLLLVLLQPAEVSEKPAEVATLAFLFVILAGSAYPTFFWSGRNSESRATLLEQPSPNQALADFLAKNGLRYGYANFWQAGVVSVLSGERVLVRQITLQNGIPAPMRHLSSNHWYRPSAWTGETFLLLASQDTKAFDPARLASHGVTITRELAFGDYKVYVFPENIAGKLPGWDWTYESPVRFIASKHSLSRTGRFVEDIASGGPALIAEKGEAGVLHFGPYVNVEPGKYVVSFDIQSAHHRAGVARMDVASAGAGARVLGERVLTESAAAQEIAISLDQRRSIEFRVWALGNERVVLRAITVRRVGDSVP